ncbi:hypothetical protein NHQ30_000700 [Ciborinia camelliae]|nr:hypothetical protein NHQ30_000700 [Ciborinia camelliae]
MAESMPTGANAEFPDNARSARVLVELDSSETNEYRFERFYYEYVRKLLLRTTSWEEAFALYQTPTHNAGTPVFFKEYDLPGVQKRYAQARRKLEKFIKVNNERAELRENNAGRDEKLWLYWEPRRVFPPLPTMDWEAVKARGAARFEAANPGVSLNMKGDSGDVDEDWALDKGVFVKTGQADVVAGLGSPVARNSSAAGGSARPDSAFGMESAGLGSPPLPEASFAMDSSRLGRSTLPESSGMDFSYEMDSASFGMDPTRLLGSSTQPDSSYGMELSYGVDYSHLTDPFRQNTLPRMGPPAAMSHSARFGSSIIGGDSSAPPGSFLPPDYPHGVSMAELLADARRSGQEPSALTGSSTPTGSSTRQVSSTRPGPSTRRCRSTRRGTSTRRGSSTRASTRSGASTRPGSLIRPGPSTRSGASTRRCSSTQLSSSVPETSSTPVSNVSFHLPFPSKNEKRTKKLDRTTLPLHLIMTRILLSQMREIPLSASRIERRRSRLICQDD